MSDGVDVLAGPMMGTRVEFGLSPLLEGAPAGVPDSADSAILRSAAAAICSRRAALLSES